MAITAILRIFNLSGEIISIINQENPNAKGNTIPALYNGDAQRYQSIWVPWCTSRADYDSGHYLLVTALTNFLKPAFPPTTIIQWNAGGIDAVRSSTDPNPGFDAANPWPAIAGSSTAGGDKDLIIGPGGALTLQDYGTFSLPENWRNWSGNLLYTPKDSSDFIFRPTNLAELKKYVAHVANKSGATMRVTGQRHSVPPLVASDTRAAPTKPEFLVDMAAYADLGPNQDQNIVLVPGTTPGHRQVTVNTGVREDLLDAFLTSNNLMLKTVTAGGFFSVGGMIAVDVHGASLDTPIFAETVSSITILRADLTVETIDLSTAAINGYSPLQFERVGLGALGIMTSVTIDVLDRPYATTLQAQSERVTIKDQASFIAKFKSLTQDQRSRLETFFWPGEDFLTLRWHIDDNPSIKTPNDPAAYTTQLAIASAQVPPVIGAPVLDGAIGIAAPIILGIYQYKGVQGVADVLKVFGVLGWLSGPFVATTLRDQAFGQAESQLALANNAHSEMWLQQAIHVIFMSYFIPLPLLDDAGLGKAWDALNVPPSLFSNDFRLAVPMEFRFVRGGDTALSGTFAAQSPANTWFLSVEVIGVAGGVMKDYDPSLLQFFAAVERQWVTMGGVPHNGKMFGFFDPQDPDPSSYSKSGPFNPNFLIYARGMRGSNNAPLGEFNKYRTAKDPHGLFYNQYMQQLLG